MKFENLEPLARNEDPSTSHESGRELTGSGKRDTDKSLLLAFVRGGREGYTARELAELISWEYPRVHKRLPDLARDGYLRQGATRRCHVTGRRALTWWLSS